MIFQLLVSVMFKDTNKWKVIVSEFLGSKKLADMQIFILSLFCLST
jgi:hypothetical protein